jgi:CheY-like chemotaxis protein
MQVSVDAEPERADVLIVDDDAVVRTSIKRLLESAGLRVLEISSAIGASRTILQHHVRLVLVDLRMPAMAGSALVGLLRKSPRLQQVPMVLVSGAPADELVTAAAEVGADAAVSKLEMNATLVPLVRRLLRRSAHV